MTQRVGMDRDILVGSRRSDLECVTGMVGRGPGNPSETVRTDPNIERTDRRNLNRIPARKAEDSAAPGALCLPRSRAARHYDSKRRSPRNRDFCVHQSASRFLSGMPSGSALNFETNVSEVCSSFGWK